MKEQIEKWENNQEREVSSLKNLEDCYDWLKEKVVDYEEFGNEEEDHALGMAHMGMGMWIRNTLDLWKDCDKKTSERSDLVKWFNNKGIYHPDDISGIILTSFHRHLNNKNIKLKSQIKKYRKYWDKHQPSINEGNITLWNYLNLQK